MVQAPTPEKDMAMTPDEFFSGRPDSRRLFDVLRAAIETLGPANGDVAAAPSSKKDA